MSELRERLHALDDIATPDQWPDIVDRPGRTYSEPGPTRRLAVAALAIVVFSVAALAVIRAFGGEAGHPGRHQSTPAASGDLFASGVTADGRFRCTARIQGGVMRPGEPTDVVLSIQNLTSRKVSLYRGLGTGSFTITAGGQEVWDSNAPLAYLDGGIPFPSPLAAGAAAALPAMQTMVVWPGPVTVNATCKVAAVTPGPDKVTHYVSPDVVTLAPITVPVTWPGRAAPSPDQALADALGASGGLFSQCVPSAAGTWTVGSLTIAAPDSTFSLPARCSARVELSQGFDIVMLQFVSPAGAPDIALPAVPIAQMQILASLPAHSDMEAGRWVFLVTDGTARPLVLESAWHTTTKGGTSRSFMFNGASWDLAPGSYPCGRFYYLSEINLITECGR